MFFSLNCPSTPLESLTFHTQLSNAENVMLLEAADGGLITVEGMTV